MGGIDPGDDRMTLLAGFVIVFADAGAGEPREGPSAPALGPVGARVVGRLF
jgi:hypothetical protein